MKELHDEIEAKGLRCDTSCAGYMQALTSLFVGNKGKPSFDFVFPEKNEEQNQVKAMPPYVRTALAFLVMTRLDKDIGQWDITALVTCSGHVCVRVYIERI